MGGGSKYNSSGDVAVAVAAVLRYERFSCGEFISYIDVERPVGWLVGSSCSLVPFFTRSSVFVLLLLLLFFCYFI